MTSELSGYNLYISYLKTGMGDDVDITFDIDLFWNSDQHFDIVHIHWPEHVAGYRMDDPQIAEKYENRLRFWKDNKACLVVTRHNYVPHDDKYNLQTSYDRIYDISYKLCDAIVHIEKPSCEEFENKAEFGKTKNVVINHPNYFVGIPNNISKDQARKKLGIKKDDVLILTFGILRKLDEETQIIKAFLKANIKNKKLLVTRSYMRRTRPTKQHPFKRLLHELKMFGFRRKGIIFDKNDVIEQDETQVYMNAADVVISPRIHSLNSGVIYMAFSFGRLVIGPDSGNIGWLLKKTKNPIFQPNDIKSLTLAMEQSVELSRTDLPQRNYEYVKQNGDIYELGKQYIILYQELINNKNKEQNV